MQQFLRMFAQGPNGGLPTFFGGAPGADPRQAALSTVLGMSGPIRKNMSGDIILPGTVGTGERSKLDDRTFSGLDAYHAMQRDGGVASRARYQAPTFSAASAMRKMNRESAWNQRPVTLDTRDQRRSVAPKDRLAWLDAVNRVSKGTRRPTGGY
jgi:hypothetical protein